LDVILSNGGTPFTIDLSDLAEDGDVTQEISDTATVLRSLITASDAGDLDTDPTNEYNTAFTINGSGTADSISITDAGSTKSIDLGALVIAMDNDGLATDTQLDDTASVLRTYIDTEVAASSGSDGDQVTGNEYNTSMGLSGTVVQVTDPGGTEGVDLDPVFATDSDVTTEIGDTSAVIRNLILNNEANDLDKDNTNEFNTGMGLSGTTVQVTDAGGTEGVDLDPVFATDSDVTTEIGDTSAVIRNLILNNEANDLDKDNTNEYNTGMGLSGTTVQVTDAGGTEGVDLDPTFATDGQLSDTATVLRSLINASDAGDLDTDPTNEHNTSFTINGSGTADSLSITDSGSTKSVDLGALVTAMNDDGLATDTQLSDTASVLRTYINTNDKYLGKVDQTLQGARQIITAGFNLRITGTGQVGIGSAAIPANSKLFVDGLISSSSDRRLKNEILGLEYGLDEVLNLNPVSYVWADTEKNKMEGKQLGFIAQEVKEIMPELVRGEEGKDKYLSLTYDRFAPVLVNAIKELKAELALVKAELENAQVQNQSLQSENELKANEFEYLKAELDQIKNLLMKNNSQSQNIGHE
jgi:hypothetical protein